jgi:hypothetical protein
MYAKFNYNDCHYEGKEGGVYTESARRLKQQMAFFTRVYPSLRLKHWQIYETGWPYARGGFIKRVISSCANLLGGRQLFGSTFGNRFSGIFVYHRPAGGLVQSGPLS